ncbi:MAG: diaminopimelate epimerase [Lachnospiraceae bacterium]|nr:diaminopimelate epimerase [Lachnospiraceae bacterium]
MKFTKMHGCGNDYIYVNGFTEKITQEEKPELVQRLSDRHFGIGGDGVIFINPSDEADFEMEMYNADGSRAEMCGNGIRCVAKFVYDKGLTDKTDISVISCGKIKYLQLFLIENKVDSVRVNMGAPELQAGQIPVIVSGGKNDTGFDHESGTVREKENNVDEGAKEGVIDEPITVQGKEYKMTCVSMGNPHAVVFMDNVTDLEIEKIGPHFENHERFPNRINTEFVKVLDRKTVQMRVWERGTGETLACGTGCCATVVACVLNGLTDDTVTVKLLGGEIEITWDREADLVYMTGPAVTVFEGEWS